MESVKSERDKLLGDVNYLKKKLQSVVLENEKLIRTLQKQGLELSHTSNDMQINEDQMLNTSLHS